jgi:hypothetical protein
LWRWSQDNAGYSRRGKVNDEAGDDANETAQSELLQKVFCTS